MTWRKKFCFWFGWLPKPDLILNLLNFHGVGKTPQLTQPLKYKITVSERNRIYPINGGSRTGWIYPINRGQSNFIKNSSVLPATESFQSF